MPRDTTPADIADAYIEGWRLGLKALAIYRDGSKESQPLSTRPKATRRREKQAAAPRRERLPDTRQSITHKFSVAGHEGYITVGLYEDGRPGELFITMAKEGSTIGGLMDCFGTAVSMSLQYGVPLEVYVNKFSHTRFEPMGHTKNPDIRIAKSIVDYIFRWLGITFLPGYREAQQGLQGDEGPAAEAKTMSQLSTPAAKKAGGPNAGPGAAKNGAAKASAANGASTPAAKAVTPSPLKGEGRGEGDAAPRASSSAAGAVTARSPDRATTENGHAKKSDAALLERAGVAMKGDLNGGRFSTQSEQFAKFQLDAPSCDNCGSITVRAGNCYLCYNCGNSMGCS